MMGGATTESKMRTIAILGAAILATAIAGPTMAKTVHHRHMAAHQAAQQQDANAGWSFNNGWNGERHDNGFWPADVAAGAVGTAAGVAGAAIGTAGAIATAPFGAGDAYAYDHRVAAAPPPIALEPAAPYEYDRGENGYYGNWDSYAARNGIGCRPGTVTKGDDGRRHVCQ
jgi:hypothetical protein